jgi:hypothetical protein
VAKTALIPLLLSQPDPPDDVAYGVNFFDVSASSISLLIIIAILPGSVVISDENIANRSMT